MGRRTCNVDKSQAEPFESHSREDVLNFARIQSGEERERQSACFSHWGGLHTNTVTGLVNKEERPSKHSGGPEDEEEKKKRSRCCDLTVRCCLGGIRKTLTAQPPTRLSAPASNTHTPKIENLAATQQSQQTYALFTNSCFWLPAKCLMSVI